MAGAEPRVAVDSTLVGEMLALTPEERLRQNDRMLRTIQERGRSPPPMARINRRAAILKKRRFSRSPAPMIRGGLATATGSRSRKERVSCSALAFDAP